jgi:hypothetical protein
MRRTVVVRCAALAAAATLVAAPAVFAQEMTFSGEVKTGIYMEQEQIGSNDPVANGGATNNDGDSGSGEGRVRLDFRFVYENMGLRVRFQVEPASGAQGPFLPLWSFAYAYGNLFNDQLTVSAGLLGESPWGTGGPKLRGEPETREYIGRNDLSGDPYTANAGLMGIRFEYKPSFVPGLNVGFVVNQPDMTTIDVQNQTFADVLKESVIGAAYEHDYFAVRVGYRFDSEADTYGNKFNEGGRLTYRAEERILDTLITGMKVWLNGDYYGIGCEQRDFTKNGKPVKLGVGEYLVNWLYWQWDAADFIAQFDVCFASYQSYNNPEFNATVPERQEYQSLEFLPAFYYKFFDNLLQAGVKLGFGMEFGSGKTYINSPYQYISVEPQVRLNIGGNAYVAAVYNFTDKYVWFDEIDRRGEKSKKHSLNIRAVYTF